MVIVFAARGVRGVPVVGRAEDGAALAVFGRRAQLSQTFDLGEGLRAEELAQGRQRRGLL